MSNICWENFTTLVVLLDSNIDKLGFKLVFGYQKNKLYITHNKVGTKFSFHISNGLIDRKKINSILFVNKHKLCQGCAYRFIIHIWNCVSFSNVRETTENYP